MVLSVCNLPEDLLLSVFQHLDLDGFFRLFDLLNPHLQRILADFQCTLHLTFEDVPEPKFDQLCERMRSYPHFEKKIRALELVNKDGYRQIDKFMSSSEPDELSNLQSLILDYGHDENVNCIIHQLKNWLILLTKLPKLSSLNFIVQLSNHDFIDRIEDSITDLQIMNANMIFNTYYGNWNINEMRFTVVICVLKQKNLH
jgi:hypothetical protein